VTLARQGSISFLKKRNKKLLFFGSRGPMPAAFLNNKKFFGSFFQKRTTSFTHRNSQGLAPPCSADAQKTPTK
jgi:hypothetical protein